MVTFSLIILSVVSVFSIAQADTIVWTNTAGGDWNNAANWDPNEIPGSGDTVEVTNDASYTVNVDGTANAGNLIVGTCDLDSTNTQVFQVNGGNEFILNGTVIVTTNGQFNLNNSSVMVGTNAFLVGTMNGAGATLSGTLTIESNSVFNIGSPGSMTFNGYFAGIGVVYNYGTVNWNAASAYEDNNGIIYNYGLWLSQTDSIMYGRASGGNGTFDNYGIFEKSGGTNTTLFDGNGTFNNYGEVDIQSGMFNVETGQDNGLINTTNDTAMTFANFILSGTNTFTGAGVITNSALEGTNAVIEGTLAVAGQITIGGSVTIDSGAQLQLLTGVTFDGYVNGNFIPCQFTNNGTVLWSTNNLYGDYLPIIDNYGTWVAEGDNTFFGRQYAGPTTFNNYGTFQKLGTSGTTTMDANTVFNNYGKVDIESGIVDVPIGQDSGLINIATNSAMTFVNFVLIGTNTFTGEGVLTNSFLVGTNAVIEGNLTLAASIVIGGSITVDQGAEIQILSGVTFDGYVNGNYIPCLFTNNGTVYWDTNNISADNLPIIDNYGTWVAQSDNTFFGRQFAGPTTFNNYGTFQKFGTGGVTTMDGNTIFNNYSEVDIESGTFDVLIGQDSGLINTATNTAMTFANFILNGTNTFTGAGVLTNSFLVGTNAVIEGNLALAASIVIGGSITIDQGAGMQILSGVTFDGYVDGNFIPCLFTNNGTVLWTTNNLYGDYLPIIDNYGTWVAQSDNTFFGRQYAGPSTFNNFGVFRKLGTSGMTTMDANTVFNNLGGRLQTATGSVAIQTGNGYGIFDTANNSQLQFSKFYFTADSVFTNTGIISGLLEATNAVFDGILNISNVTMSGNFTLQSDCTLNIGLANMVINGYPNPTTITNYGTVNWITGSIFGDNGPNIDNYGLWLCQTNGTFSGRSSNGQTTFNNFGTFRKTGGTGTTALFPSYTFNNSGTLDVQIGTVELYLYSLSNGLMNFGLNSPTNYGQVNLYNTATLGGTISVNLNNLFVPKVGNTFNIVTYSGENGAFTNLNLPPEYVWTNNTLNYEFALGIASVNPIQNVTNFGAIGDAVQFFVNTTSNSSLVTTTNQLSPADIGKAIEVFGAGTPTSSGFNQDLVTTIANVVGATNIYLGQPCQQYLTNTFATYGHNNTAIFQSVITKVGPITNATIDVPAGTYLLLPTNYPSGYSYCSILLQRGGINFVGAGTNSTTLLSKGAWTLINGSVVRGFLVELASPMTNNFPVSFSDLTMDGGVQNGNTLNHTFTASVVNGSGWDVTHSAVLSWIANGGYMSSINFTNDLVQHWRGEEFKSIDQPYNSRIGIYNCTFSDGNATALNIYPAWNVISNNFVNMFQVAEYYMAYSSYPSYFAYNTITNITGNGFALNGGTGTNAPFMIESNKFYYSSNGENGIETLPGDNVSIIGNQIVSTGSGDAAISLGALGYQGTFCNSNIVIAGNNVSGGAYFVEIGSGPPNNLDTAMIYSNTVILATGGAKACQSYGLATNVHFYANNFPSNPATAWSTGLNYDETRVGQFALVDSNNTYAPDFYSAYTPTIASGTTNIVSYANGPFFTTAKIPSGVTFVLEDSSSNQIPHGAFINFDNSQNVTAGYHVYYSQSMSTGYQTVGPLQRATFYWNSQSDSWQEGALQYKAVPASGVPPVTIRFTGPGVDPVGNSLSQWNWSFADGSLNPKSAAQNPTHTYYTTGVFVPSLIVTNTAGATYVVTGPPIVIANPPLGLTVTRTNLSLTWTTNYAGFSLESTTSLNPPINWTLFNNVAALTNGNNFMSMSKTNPQMYFRLVEEPYLSTTFSGGHFFLAWPYVSGPTTYTLLSTTNLTPPITWTPVTVPPNVIGAWNVISNVPSSPQMFYEFSNQ